MTKKEFITNLLRELGFEVLHYNSNSYNPIPRNWLGSVEITVGFKGIEGTTKIYVYVDESTWTPGRYYIKFKYCPILDCKENDYLAVKLVRETNAFLKTRGFENCVANWTKYRGDFHRTISGGYRFNYDIVPGTGFLSIGCTGSLPWHQCKAYKTKKELEDELLM